MAIPRKDGKTVGTCLKCNSFKIKMFLIDLRKILIWKSRGITVNYTTKYSLPKRQHG
jgi:hypothetical protein